MEEKEFLEKHGSEKLSFESSFKQNFAYKNDRFKVRGRANYRGAFYPQMTLQELRREMETFHCDHFVSGWTSPKEELPGEGETVLTISSSGKEVHARFETVLGNPVWQSYSDVGDETVVGWKREKKKYSIECGNYMQSNVIYSSDDLEHIQDKLKEFKERLEFSAVDGLSYTLINNATGETIY